MAKNKAQSVGNVRDDEVKEEVEAKDAVSETDGMEEMDAAELDEESTKDLMPLLKQLPVEMQETFTSLLAEMKPNQAGLEEMDNRWAPPFIKIRQGLSTDHPASVQLGQLYTDDGQALPTPFEFIPLYMYPANLKFDEGSANPSCRSEDGKVSIFGVPCKDCPDEPFKNGEPTDCSRYRNTFVFDVNLKRIYRLNLGKTSYKAGSKLQRYMKASGGKPWKKVYALEVQEQQRKSGQGRFYVFNIRPTGRELDNTVHIEIAKKFHDRISGIRTEVLQTQRSRNAVATQKADKIGEELGVQQAAVSGKKVGEPDFSGSM